MCSPHSKLLAVPTGCAKDFFRWVYVRSACQFSTSLATLSAMWLTEPIPTSQHAVFVPVLKPVHLCCNTVLHHASMFIKPSKTNTSGLTAELQLGHQPWLSGAPRHTCVKKKLLLLPLLCSILVDKPQLPWGQCQPFSALLPCGGRMLALACTKFVSFPEGRKVCIDSSPLVHFYSS